MKITKLISGSTEQEIWDQIEAELHSDPNLLQYQTEIDHAGKTIYLDIDIDLGGGFEGGFELTTFTTPLTKNEDFRFAVHHEEFLDEIGKFFGMQDIEVGYSEFDRNLVIKTNNPDQLKDLFSKNEVRVVFQELDKFRLYIEKSSNKGNLVLEIEEGITDYKKLRSIYRAFYQVAIKL